MAQEIKELIEKINQEGVKAAEEKAREIEADARRAAKDILEKAKKEADKILSDANERIAKSEEKGRALLAQAGRDLLLSLRKEINTMLERLISSDVHQALTHEALGKILFELIKCSTGFHKEDIIISLKKEDADALEKSFLHKLKAETKKGIILRPSDEIRAGFTISFDAGKSCYDFTNRALAEYIAKHLKPKLKELLEEAV